MTLSVPELLRTVLLAQATVTDAAQGGVVVGPASHDAQRQGVVVITEHSQAKREDYLPLAHQRLALRCIAPNQEQADRMVTAIRAWVTDFKRTVIAQPSTDEEFLVHSVLWSGGPAGGKDTDESWEELLFLELMVGMEAVAV